MLEVTLADGRVLSQRATLRAEPERAPEEGPSTLARLARARELKALTDAEAGAALAVCYQPLSPWTGYVVVAEGAEGEKAGELPALRKVPQMLAAGWGGTGSVDYRLDTDVAARLSVDVSDIPAFQRRQGDRPEPLESRAAPRAGEDAGLPLPPRCPLRSLFRRGMATPRTEPVGSLPALVAALNFRYPAGSGGTLAISTLQDLARLVAPASILEALARVVAAGHAERDVVVTFLQWLSEGLAGVGLGRRARRVIAKGYKQLGLERAARQVLHEALGREPALASL